MAYVPAGGDRPRACHLLRGPAAHAVDPCLRISDRREGPPTCRVPSGRGGRRASRSEPVTHCEPEARARHRRSRSPGEMPQARGYGTVHTYSHGMGAARAAGIPASRCGSVRPSARAKERQKHDPPAQPVRWRRTTRALRRTGEDCRWRRNPIASQGRRPDMPQATAADDDAATRGHSWCAHDASKAARTRRWPPDGSGKEAVGLSLARPTCSAPANQVPTRHRRHRSSRCPAPVAPWGRGAEPRRGRAADGR
jgi:hypothetical protein